MTDDSPSSLDVLERQWRATKAPKLGLQLAEEYRRRDDLGAAIEVLEAGVANRPEHMSSRVALSRYLVDGGRLEPALEHLEQIVKTDPVHLVANKLLVRSYVGLGRFDEARDKLDIYEMLAEGDADIEGLRAAIDGELPPPAVDSTAASESIPSEPEPADIQPLGELLTPAEAVETIEPIVSSVAEPAVSEQASGVSGVAGVLAGSAEATEPPAAVPFEIEMAGAGSADDVAAPLESPEEPFGSNWTPREEPEFWAQVADEGIFSLEDPGDLEAGIEKAGEGEALLAKGLEDSAAKADSTAAPESTVTLGELYLEQGHPDEAADTFRRVLASEPDNRRARKGLEAIDALAVGGVSRAERRMAILTAYRARLRNAFGANT